MSLRSKYGGTIENVFTSLKQKEKKLDEYYNYDEILKEKTGSL